MSYVPDIILLRPRSSRSGGENFAAPRQSLRAKRVTYVVGTFCYPCLRVGQVDFLAPRHGFEPRFTAPKAAVLPLDDRGLLGDYAILPSCSQSPRRCCFHPLSFHIWHIRSTGDIHYSKELCDWLDRCGSARIQGSNH